MGNDQANILTLTREIGHMVATLLVFALALAVGVGVWAALRRDVSGAVGSLGSALFMGFMGALLFPR
jgi:hypothetical protein